MLPRLKQFRGWSLPAKASYIGLVLALLSLPATLSWLYNWARSVPQYAVLAFDYDSSEMTIYGAAGDAKETAIIIRGAKSHGSGVEAEHYWLKRRFPGYRTVSTAVFTDRTPARIAEVHIQGTDKQIDIPVSTEKRRVYDVFTIENWLGFERTVYFDITGFWGASWEDGNSRTVADVIRPAARLMQDDKREMLGSANTRPEGTMQPADPQTTQTDGTN